MGAYQNSVKRTEIGVITMMGALGNGTFNALIRMAIHSCILLSLLITIVLPIFLIQCILFATLKNAKMQQHFGIYHYFVFISK